MGGDKVMKYGRVWVLPAQHEHARRKNVPPLQKTVAGGCVGSLYRYISLLSTLIYLSLPLSPVNPTPRLLPGFSVGGIQITFLSSWIAALLYKSLSLSAQREVVALKGYLPHHSSYFTLILFVTISVSILLALGNYIWFTLWKVFINIFPNPIWIKF